MTHLFPKNIRKFFIFKRATSHKRKRTLTKRQHKAFHTKQFAQREGFERVVPHEHEYIDKRTGRVRYEEYSDRTVKE